jgi:hypothetical protein
MPLILVYLGHKIPSYVLVNLKNLRRQFPHQHIVLITERYSLISESTKTELNLEVYVYTKNENLHDLELSKHHDLSFRNGYWSQTINRILAFLDYQIEKRLDRVLHIEADMALMPNFPFEAIAPTEVIVWGYYNEQRDVGALIFVPGAKDAEWLRDAIVKTWKQHPDFTDMQLLKEISNSHKDRISYWPSGLSMASNVNSLVNVSELKLISKRQVNVGGIIDVAAIGMWLCGIDPRNNRGKKIHFSNSFISNGDSWVDPSVLKYIFHEKEIISIGTAFGEVPLYALHNHSKNEKYFGKFRGRYLARLYSNFVRRGVPITRISPRSFLLLASESILRRIPGRKF